MLAGIGHLDSFFAGAEHRRPRRRSAQLPQSAQNLLPAGFSAPHAVHRTGRGVPHLPQNFIPSGLAAPQLGHSMPHPIDWIRSGYHSWRGLGQNESLSANRAGLPSCIVPAIRAPPDRQFAGDPRRGLYCTTHWRFRRSRATTRRPRRCSSTTSAGSSMVAWFPPASVTYATVFYPAAASN
jgi:hypothetical protein